MISIIIPTFNRDRLLSLAVETLVQQDFPTDQFEILIIDNGSTDSTRSVAEKCVCQYSSHQIRYIYEPEPGLLSGRHRGAQEANGDILIFVDDDIVATPNFLVAIQEAFRDPTVQLVGGKNLPKFEADPPTWLDWFWYETSEGRFCAYLSLMDLGDEICAIDPNSIWGLNFSIRKQALFDLGGFHPDSISKHLQRFQGDGETGLTMKAAQRGYKAIYHPAALVFHQVPKSRMTYEYFDQRSFYQGVSDSYSSIRGNGRNLLRLVAKEKVKSLKSTLEYWKGSLIWQFSSLEKVPLERKMLRKLTHKAYCEGYRFHQNEVWNDPILLDWVLRENYWDYKLPQISAQAFK